MSVPAGMESTATDSAGVTRLGVVVRLTPAQIAFLDDMIADGHHAGRSDLIASIVQDIIDDEKARS